MQVLFLVCAPNAPVVRLIRTVSSGYDAAGSNFSSGPKAHRKVPLASVKTISDVTPLRATEHAQRASWWSLPTYEDSMACTSRELQGEIHLPGNLFTTSHLGRYDFVVRTFCYLWRTTNSL